MRIIDASLAKEVAGDSSPCGAAFEAAAGSEPFRGNGSDGNFVRARGEESGILNDDGENNSIFGTPGVGGNFAEGGPA